MHATDQDAVIDDEERELLRAVLDHVLKNSAFPSVDGFRYKHAPQAAMLEELVARGLLKEIKERYYLTLPGLRACDSEEAREQIEQCKRILPELQEAWRKQRGIFFSVSDLNYALDHPTDPHSLPYYGIPLGILLASGLISASVSDTTGLPYSLINLEGLLYVDNLDTSESRGEASPSLDLTGIALQKLEISGYRPFAGFSAELGDLTVIIGANATGKSSLFDLLRFVCFAAESPLPPEIDPRSAGKLLFHAGGAERLSFALIAGRRGGEPLRYEVEIQGPVGSPKVLRERFSIEKHAESGGPLMLIDMRAGKGMVRDLGEVHPSQEAWTVPANELALRRAIAPNLPTLSRFQNFIASFRVYPGFDIAPTSALRRAAQVEENPILAEDGANLSAVLHSLVLEHREAWEELETYLGATIPGFLSLGVKPRAKGMAIAFIRERGVKEELTLADLSDGTLRLLCWLALAVSPSLPPVVCIDEPEIGLHPRVLPTLAGAMKLASGRSQLLIATHSPHFLAQFRLDEIAVMRKDEGRAVFVRPATSDALRREVEELGGEAIARLFLSEELEVLP